MIVHIGNVYLYVDLIRNGMVDNVYVLLDVSLYAHQVHTIIQIQEDANPDVSYLINNGMDKAVSVL